MTDVHVDAVRYAFVKAYGSGEFTHSDENQMTGWRFDDWLDSVKNEAMRVAWSECLSTIENDLDMALGFIKNPYSEVES